MPGVSPPSSNQPGRRSVSRIQEKCVIMQFRLKRRRTASASATQSRLRLAARSCIESLERRLFLSTTNASLLADASVRNGTSADTNFGSAPQLFIQDPTAGNDTQITFLKFDISGITTINSATLKLNGSLFTAGDPSVSAMRLWRFRHDMDRRWDYVQHRAVNRPGHQRFRRQPSVQPLRKSRTSTSARTFSRRSSRATP